MGLYGTLNLFAAAGEIIFLFFIIADIIDCILSIVKKSMRKITIKSFRTKFLGVFYLSCMMAPTFYLTEYSLSEESNYSSFRLLYSIIALVLCVYSSYQDIKEHK